MLLMSAAMSLVSVAVLILWVCGPHRRRAFRDRREDRGTPLVSPDPSDELLKPPPDLDLQDAAAGPPAGVEEIVALWQRARPSSRKRPTSSESRVRSCSTSACGVEPDSSARQVANELTPVPASLPFPSLLSRAVLQREVELREWERFEFQPADR